MDLLAYGSLVNCCTIGAFFSLQKPHMAVSVGGNEVEQLTRLAPQIGLQSGQQMR